MNSFFLIISAVRQCPLILVLTVLILCCGCRSGISPEQIQGRWMGNQTEGNVTVNCEWTLLSDGTDTISLTLPQGRLLSSGRWEMQDGSLVVHTLTRTMILKSQQKTMPLLNPMESKWHCDLNGDHLTLKSANFQDSIVLSRTAGATP